jgi:integrase
MEAAVSEERAVPGSAARRHTLAEAIDRYKQTVMPQKRWATARKQLQQLEWWRGHQGARRLSEIIPAGIADVRDMLARGRSPVTVVRYLAALSHVYTVAITEWQWTETNPVQRVGKPSEPSGRARFLDERELQTLLAACQRSRSEYLYPLVLLALSTGARRGDLLELTWKDVDLRRGAVTFRDTKNKETRTVAVRGRALKVLQSRAKARQLHEGRVFPGKGGRQLDLKRAWLTAVRRAGLEDFRFHDLRHSAASYLAMSGATLPEIGAILGHKTPAMTARYAHKAESHSAEVLDRMTSRFLGERA